MRDPITSFLLIYSPPLLISICTPFPSLTNRPEVRHQQLLSPPPPVPSRTGVSRNPFSIETQTH